MVNKGRFFKGDPRCMIKTEAHRRAISEGCKRGWRTKRQRKPIGSTWVDSAGYIRVKVSEPCTYWIPEHLLVAQKKLGRDLGPQEIVHHIDIVPGNNQDSNLHVFPDRASHNESHRSLNDLVAGLLAEGIISFDPLTGKYRR